MSNFVALCCSDDIISSLSLNFRYKSKEIINTDDDLSTDTDEEKPLKPKYTTIWWQLYDDSTQNPCKTFLYPQQLVIQNSLQLVISKPGNYPGHLLPVNQPPKTPRRGNERNPQPPLNETHQNLTTVTFSHLMRAAREGRSLLLLNGQWDRREPRLQPQLICLMIRSGTRSLQTVNRLKVQAAPTRISQRYRHYWSIVPWLLGGQSLLEYLVECD